MVNNIKVTSVKSNWILFDKLVTQLPKHICYYYFNIGSLVFVSAAGLVNKLTFPRAINTILRSAGLEAHDFFAIQARHFHLVIQALLGAVPFSPCSARVCLKFFVAVGALYTNFWFPIAVVFAVTDEFFRRMKAFFRAVFLFVLEGSTDGKVVTALFAYKSYLRAFVVFPFASVPFIPTFARAEFGLRVIVSSGPKWFSTLHASSWHAERRLAFFGAEIIFVLIRLILVFRDASSTCLALNSNFAITHSSTCFAAKPAFSFAYGICTSFKRFSTISALSFDSRHPLGYMVTLSAAILSFFARFGEKLIIARSALDCYLTHKKTSCRLSVEHLSRVRNCRQKVEKNYITFGTN
jgi:hypothetical protein